MRIQAGRSGRGIGATVVGVAVLAVGAALSTSGPAIASGERQTLGPEQPVALTDVRPLIANGAPTSIRSAPWQVYIKAGTLACGGVIQDSTRIITAAHCVVDPATSAPRPLTSLSVRAGISNVVKPAATDAPQTASVASIRVHPGYVAAGPSRADDVAVLRLKSALNLAGPAARAIPIATAPPAVGTLASLTGFGQQSPTAASNGQLYSLQTGVVDQVSCGGPDNALLLCVASATGSACSGDSGGPMTVGATLVGISTFGTGTPLCQPGSLNGYANLAAPEIAAFVAGSDTPPLAPRGGTGVSAQGVLRVGRKLTCSAGSWTNGPTFAFTFLDAASGAVLQSGPSATYVFRQADRGRSVACQVAATTPGGTGLGRTGASPPIAAGRPKLALSVKAPKRPIRPSGTLTLSIRVVNRGAATARRVKLCTSVSHGMRFVRIPRGAKRKRLEVCSRIKSLRVGRGRKARIKVRVPRITRTRPAKMTVTVRAKNAAKRRSTIRLVARRG